MSEYYSKIVKKLQNKKRVDFLKKPTLNTPGFTFLLLFFNIFIKVICKYYNLCDIIIKVCTLFHCIIHHL